MDDAFISEMIPRSALKTLGHAWGMKSLSSHDEFEDVIAFRDHHLQHGGRAQLMPMVAHLAFWVADLDEVILQAAGIAAREGYRLTAIAAATAERNTARQSPSYGPNYGGSSGP